jgi:glycosyltransferase involved in cell wall biosynthesis
MLTYNDGDKIDCSIESILNQTVSLDRLRVMIIDNASTDDTYKKLIDYEVKYPQLISVMREKHSTTRGRLLKNLTEHLRFSLVDVSVILNPGDTISPDFIKYGMELLRLNAEAGMIAFETNIHNGKTEIQQLPIFSENCILNGLCSKAYFQNGIGHKIQTLFRTTPLDTAIKLPYYSLLAEHNEWFVLSYFKNVNCIYVNQPYGSVYPMEETDVISTLIKKAFYMKRNFYSIETNVFSNLHANNIESQEVDAGYRCLAIMALRSAVPQLKRENYKIVEDCLIFAEMMYSAIAQEEVFEQIQKALQSKQFKLEEISQLLEEKTCDPPRESFVF